MGLDRSARAHAVRLLEHAGLLTDDRAKYATDDELRRLVAAGFGVELPPFEPEPVTPAADVITEGLADPQHELHGMLLRHAETLRSLHLALNLNDTALQKKFDALIVAVKARDAKARRVSEKAKKGGSTPRKGTAERDEPYIGVWLSVFRRYPNGTAPVQANAFERGVINKGLRPVGTTKRAALKGMALERLG